MSLFVIGDTHLSLSVNKPMDIFGGWKNYMQRLEENWWAIINKEDTVVIPGDVSWGMTLEEPRLLVDHQGKDGCLSGTKRIFHPDHPAQ